MEGSHSSAGSDELQGCAMEAVVKEREDDSGEYVSECLVDAGAGAEFQQGEVIEDQFNVSACHFDAGAGAEFQQGVAIEGQTNVSECLFDAGAGAEFQQGVVIEGKVTEKEVRGEESRRMGNAHDAEKGVNSSSHQHAQFVSDPSCDLSGGCVGSVGSAGCGGSLGWVLGRWSARLSSSWCCPGCGLYGDGTLCMMCDGDGVHNSTRGNSDGNLRMVRRPERNEVSAGRFRDPGRESHRR